MASAKITAWRLRLIRLLAGIGLVRLAAVVIYGLSKVMTPTLGGAAAGGVVGLLSILLAKSFEFQKQHEAAIAEKKREVYRRLLVQWERVLVEIRANKPSEELLSTVDFTALYASQFDAVLYGSEKALQRYVEFRSPEAKPDPIDMLRALAGLLIAMREDVTGRPSTLSEDVVLRTFVNFKPEEIAILRLREYVSKNPDLLRRLAETQRQQPKEGGSAGTKPSGG